MNRQEDDKIYPNSDFITSFGVTKDKAREFVKSRLEKVNFNKEEMKHGLEWGEFIFDMMCLKDDKPEEEWAKKYDLSDKFTASDFIMYVTTD